MVNPPAGLPIATEDFISCVRVTWFGWTVFAAAVLQIFKRCHTLPLIYSSSKKVFTRVYIEFLGLHDLVYA